MPPDPRPSSRRAAAVRRFLRRGARRATGAAATRYRTAVIEQSRWLPAYLKAVDTTDVALRAVRSARGRPVPAGAWDEPDPAVPGVLRAGLSGTGELSLVLTGPSPWRRSVGGVALAFDDNDDDDNDNDDDDNDDDDDDERTVAVVLEGAPLDQVDGHIRLFAALPADGLAPGRYRMVLLGSDGSELPHVPVARAALRSKDASRPTRLEVEDGALLVVRGADDTVSIEHRVSTGIARLTLEWTPPASGPDDVVLLDPDGTTVRRIAGTPGSRDFALLATLDAGALLGDDLGSDVVLTVAVPGPNGSVPLVLAPGRYPALRGAPPHGTARLGTTRVRAGYDDANRLQLHLERLR